MKARGGDVEQRARLGQPLRRAPRAGRSPCCRRRATIRSRDFLLEHQRQAASKAPGSRPSQLQQQRRGDVVGQVGDDAARRRRRARGRRSSARRPRRRQPAGHRPRRSRPSAGRQRASRSIATTCAAPASSSARVSPPGPGRPRSRCRWPSAPAARAMRPVRLRSRRKCWPSASWPPGHGAAMTSRSGGSAVDGDSLRRLPRASARVAGRARRQAERGDQAVGRADAVAGDIEARCRGRARCARTAGRASR